MAAFDIIRALALLLAFGILLFTIGKVIVEIIRNHFSPVLRVSARIVGKRLESIPLRVTGRRSSGGSNDMSVSTSYYVTFETESGKRRELCIESERYGLLAEGDRGILTHQGTWFKDFVRTVS